MASGIAKLEIGLLVDSRLFEFYIGDHMTAGGVWVVKSEAFALQVLERMYGRTATRDEHRMKSQIRRALDQRNDSNRCAGTDIVHGAQNGKIDRAVPQAAKRMVIGIRQDQFHLLPHLLGKIGAQRLSLGHGEPIANDRQNDWLALRD